MTRCASCNTLILVGGYRVGDLRFCKTSCLVASHRRLTVGAEPIDDGDQLREDILMLVGELEKQRAVQAELLARVEFLERALGQLRAERRRGRSADYDSPIPTGSL